MPIYMIRAGEHGPVKIGCAYSPVMRLRELQPSNHERLELIRQLQGAVPEETHLHRMFADQRIHGEWFSFSRKMLGDVGIPDLSLNDGVQRLVSWSEETNARLSYIEYSTKICPKRLKLIFGGTAHPTQSEAEALSARTGGLVSVADLLRQPDAAA